MDLIYAKPSGEDIGCLLDYKYDLAYGEDENNFEITLDINNNVLKPNYKLYIENTEYGGIVDTVAPTSTESKIVYSGRSWHGVLSKKIIQPASGADYYTVSGDANTIIGSLITKLDLGGLFYADTTPSGLILTSYQFDRYIDAYNGLLKMLRSVGGKMIFSYISGRVKISALPLVDYSQDEQFDTDQVELNITKKYNGVNHMICLGSGLLSDRMVRHLYVNELGVISNTQTFFGTEEIAEVFDYPNAENETDLITNATDRLLGYLPTAEGNIDVNAETTVFDIGDRLSAKDIVTDTEIKATIVKKIITIENELITINYKVGE